MKNRIDIRKKIGINRKNENGKGERKVKWNRSYKKKENEIEGSKKIMEQELIKEEWNSSKERKMK